MDKYKFESIFKGDAVNCDFENRIPEHYGHMILRKDTFDYGSFQCQIEYMIDFTNGRVKEFEAEIAMTKKLLSEPCSGYLKHKLMDWLDHLTDTLKRDLEKYAQYKEELLIYFHYLV